MPNRPLYRAQKLRCRRMSLADACYTGCGFSTFVTIEIEFQKPKLGIQSDLIS
jgi:hypothetical protein